MNRAYSRAGIIARLFNTPLAVLPDTAAIVLGAVGQRLDVSQLLMPLEGKLFHRVDLEQLAQQELTKIEARGGIDRRAKDMRAAQLMFVHNGVAHVAVRGETVAENGIGPSSGFTGYDGIVAQVQAADADPQVKGILLDVDSPGGEVSGCFEACAVLMARRGTKPMRAMVRGAGASAAYAVAACADEITLHQLGFAGSIGVLMMHADYSQKLEQDGIKVTLFASGAQKTAGNKFEPLPAEVAARFQAMTDHAATSFFAHVAEARGLSADAVQAQQAQVYMGEEAVAAGLVDKIMSWQDSMDEFEAAVNDPRPGGQGRNAPTGARSAKGSTMSKENTAPAAEQQPEFTQAQLTEAQATARTEGLTAGATAERERITALAEIGGVALPEALSAAITDGTEAGAFAVAQARAGKDKLAAAASAAKDEAVPGAELPAGSAAAAAGGSAAQANRGEAAVSRLRGKVPGLPAKV